MREHLESIECLQIEITVANHKFVTFEYDDGVHAHLSTTTLAPPVIAVWLSSSPATRGWSKRPKSLEPLSWPATTYPRDGDTRYHDRRGN